MSVQGTCIIYVSSNMPKVRSRGKAIEQLSLLKNKKKYLAVFSKTDNHIQVSCYPKIAKKKQKSKQNVIFETESNG